MAESNMKMGDAVSITEFTEKYSGEEISFPKFFEKEVFVMNGKKYLVNFTGVLNKYHNEFKEILSKVSLDVNEYRKYRFNPKLMAFDLYGTTELWFLILEANELTKISDFDLETLYVYDTRIYELLARIIDLEKNTMDYNSELVTKALDK